MASAALLAALEFGHIISAMSWLGGGILTTFVLGPSLRELPPPAALQFNAKVLPRLLRFIQMAVGATLLFGVLLLYFYYNGDFSQLSATTEGIELSTGILLAVATGVVAWTVTLPSFKKVAQIAGEIIKSGAQQPPPELMVYGRRARIGATVGVILLLVVLAMMVAAGY